MNIYVSNLSFDVRDEDLKELFTSFGEVSSAKVITDKTTGRSRGFGFVEMSDDTAAKAAVQQLDGTDVAGRSVKVAEARPKEERPARSSNPFRSNGGGERNYNNGNSYNKNRY